MDNFEMMMKHIQDLRGSLSGTPSAATLAAWRLEDARNEIMRRYYARQEAGVEEAPHFTFTSEVKLK